MTETARNLLADITDAACRLNATLDRAADLPPLMLARLLVNLDRISGELTAVADRAEQLV